MVTQKTLLLCKSVLRRDQVRRDKGGAPGFQGVPSNRLKMFDNSALWDMDWAPDARQRGAVTISLAGWEPLFQSKDWLDLGPVTRN